MRLERINGNQIKIFLTYDELTELGFSEEDVDQNSLKWHELFFEMINEAYEEFEQFLQGTMIIDVYSLQTQGMVISFTLKDEDDFSFEHYFFQPQDVDKIKKDMMFCFTDFENIIQFANRIEHLWHGGTLFFYKDCYYLYINIENEELAQRIQLLISDYGESSTLTDNFLKEYGHCLLQKNAVENIMKYFKIR